jgi:DNA-binding beta-propeller fold protein YncE
MRSRRQRSAIPLRLLAGLSLLVAFALPADFASAATPGGVIGHFGTPGAGEGQFNGPSGVAYSAVTGEIYVADTGNNRTEAFQEGAYVSQFGTPGSGNGQFNGPMGIAVDSEGNVYVADTGNNRIEKFNLERVYVSQFGGAGSGNGQFNGPSGIAVGAEGDVYVADTGNNRIEKFSPEGMYVSQFGAPGSGDGQFNGATGLAVDSSGNVYVADVGNGRVEKFNAEGTFVSVLDTGGSQAVAVDSSANVYVVDKPTGSPVQLDVYNPTGALAYTIEAGDIGTSRGIAVTPQDEALVADAMNDDVVEFARPRDLPQAVTEAAFDPLATSVTVSGLLEDQGRHEGAHTTYRFDYGPTTSYGQSAPIPEADLGTGGFFRLRVLTTLSGLNAATTYHYRVVATNVGDGGSAYGADRTFTTVVLAPDVHTGPPSVSATAASLTGGVLAQGLDTVYHFEYGSTPSYGASVPVPDADAGSGTTPASVTESITGLTPNTTYHYRLVATSVGGTSYGVDQAFTTYTTSAAVGGVSPFGSGVAPSAGAPSYPDLAGLAPTPAPTSPRGTPAPKPPTRVQILAKALKQCHKYKRNARRRKCEHQARARYGSAKKGKGSSRGARRGAASRVGPRRDGI